MRAILKALACVLWLICLFGGGLSGTTAFGYDGETRGMMAYDGHFLPTSICYDGNEVLPVNENERHLCSGQASIASLARFLAAEETQTLFHYTNEKGLAGILDSGELNPSLKALNPNDVRYGNGQYLSDIVPGTKTPAQLSREFLGQPFQGQKYTHYIEIDVSGLNVVPGRPGVFVIPGETPLDLTGRISSSGAH